MNIPEDVMKMAKEATQSFLGMSPCYPEQFQLQDAFARAILIDREARSGWRYIASAPDDGRWFFARRKHTVLPLICKFDIKYGEFQNEDGDHVYGLTFWMPIPREPSDAPQPEASPVVPAGYKLVPVEPTLEMRQVVAADWGRRTWEQYRAVIAAAPSPSLRETEVGEVALIKELAASVGMKFVPYATSPSEPPSPAIDTSALLLEAEGEKEATAADIINKIAQVSASVGFQAGEPAMEMAGQIVSILAANPEHIDRFMSEGSGLFIDGTFNHEHGSLTYRAVNGAILSPSALREKKGQQQ